MAMMKPMLAATIENMADIRYPLLASTKLDGVRGLVINGKLMSRSLKPIPNEYVSERFSKPEYEGLDGELIFGRPDAKDVYRQTVGACMRQTGEPSVQFHVFDRHDLPSFTFKTRHTTLPQFDPFVIPVPHLMVENEKELLKFEANVLKLGYEGLMLRNPDGLYKFGRSTVKEGGSLKLKRFVDSEAEILEVIEEMENTNEKKTNELGRGKRSSHQSGMVPKGRAGALRVRDLSTRTEFNVGTGMDDDDRVFYWKQRTKVLGAIIKYKSFPIGVKDLPRVPTYLGPREAWDL